MIYESPNFHCRVLVTSQGRPEWFDLGNTGTVLEDSEVTTVCASLCLPASLHRILRRAAVSRENMMSLCLPMRVYSWAEVWCGCCWGGLQPCCHWFSSESSLFSPGAILLCRMPPCWQSELILGGQFPNVNSEEGCPTETGVNWNSQWQFVWLRIHWAFPYLFFFLCYGIVPIDLK